MDAATIAARVPVGSPMFISILRCTFVMLQTLIIP